MNSHNLIKKSCSLILLLFTSFFLLNSVSARIGETKSSIETRLSKSGGFLVKEESIIKNKQRGMPYHKYYDFLPKETEILLYHKTVDGEMLNYKERKISGMLSGWDVHIIYVEKKSVLEIYRRNVKINSLELPALLKLQSGQSFWEEKNDQEIDAQEFSAFGFDYFRNDKKLRAKKIGSNTLLFISMEFDQFLKKQFLTEQMEALPLSIKGF